MLNDYIYFMSMMVFGQMYNRPNAEMQKVKLYSYINTYNAYVKTNFTHAYIHVLRNENAENVHICVFASPCLVSLINGRSFLIRPVWCFSSDWRRVTSQCKAWYICCMLLSLQMDTTFYLNQNKINTFNDFLLSCDKDHKLAADCNIGSL